MSSPRSLRIVYVWDADYPWDVRVEKVCRALREAGHDVHIVARNRKQQPERESLPEGEVRRMRPWRWTGKLDDVLGFPAFFNPRWMALLDRVVRDVHADVIIVRDLPLCPTALWVGRRHDVPVVMDMAEHYPAMMRKIFEAGRQKPIDYVVRNPAIVSVVERYCIQRCDAILVVIQEMQQRLEALGVPPERIELVSNTPPAARADEVWSRATGHRPLQLVYLGILEVPRGIGDLIDAAALLRDEGIPVHVRIIGTGRDEKLFHARARERGVFGREVEFLGYLQSHEEALRIVADSDIGVLPHRRNEHWDHTIPNKLFDYMAAALPVITSDARPFARIVRDEEVGEIFSSRDPRSLADAVKRLVDPELRRRYGVNGQRSVRSHYNWEHDTAALLRAIRTVTSGISKNAGNLAGAV